MSNSILKIGIPSKGRLRSGVLNIFKRKKLKILSERGERDLFGFIKGEKNIKIVSIVYVHINDSKVNKKRTVKVCCVENILSLKSKK